VPKKQSEKEVTRVGKFAGVGVINTVIDFTILNVLSSSYVGLSLITANIVSTTVAMVFSFFANKKVVFKQEKGNPLMQAVLFFAVTGFGLWVLQSGIIYLLTGPLVAPLKLAYAIVKAIGLGNLFSEAFVIKNGAKVFATIVSLTWNYIAYKKVVFKKS
jgi:putative flippase GtrA